MSKRNGKMQVKVILVTGGAGFIGSNLFHSFPPVYHTIFKKTPHEGALF